MRFLSSSSCSLLISAEYLSSISLDSSATLFRLSSCSCWISSSLFSSLDILSSLSLSVLSRASISALMACASRCM
ncbi:hypothetical protein [Thermogymnomonas acidicola]|uniref:hypothetical protein n=1 Tax=Thermogymnomonas acidicola TaxID=399579 RepID=UPI0009463AFC|nr:hypothetical protein [Thermogymnomonas acidicola]